MARSGHVLAQERVIGRDQTTCLHMEEGQRETPGSFISVDPLAVEFILNRKGCLQTSQRDNRSSPLPLCVPPSALGVKGDGRRSGWRAVLCHEVETVPPCP